MNSLYVKIIALLYFSFFFFPVLNPRIEGVSVYLFNLIILFDYYFLSSIKIRKDFLLILLIILIFSLGTQNYFLPIKIFSIILSVSYFIYLTKNNLDRLIIPFFSITAIVGVTQFIALAFFSYNLLDGNSIARFIYGDLSIQTGDLYSKINYLNTGFRVSGLSTEPAFYNSLLTVSFIYIRYVLGVRSLLLIFLFILAFIFSFSRISIIYLALFVSIGIIFRFDRILNGFHALLIFLFFTILSINIIYSYVGIEHLSNSFIHRTIGYYLLNYIYYFDFPDILLGLGDFGVYKYYPDLSFLSFSPMFDNGKGNFLDNSGITEVILQYGLMGFFIISFIFFRSFHFSSVIILLSLTINVSVLTSSSFVILSWVLAYVLPKKS